MVSVVWISLSTNWSLYSVQAGLQVVIAVLCFVGIFVFTRLCWQASSLDVARNRPVSLPSLLSIHTLSEAYDAVYLLRFRILHRNHWKILAQCILVVVLSVSTIISGPIAKASTRLGMVVRTVQAEGLLSNRGFDSYTYGYVQWNETISKLNNAVFPTDQLLDFLPDPRYDWVYNPSEWNSSWAMSCNRTESTTVTLYDTGRCTTIYTELPGLEDVFPPANFSVVNVFPFSLSEGYYHTKDALMIMTGWTPNVEKGGFGSFGSRNMTFSVAAVLMSNLNQDSNVNNTCYFDKGDVGSSSYTLAQCEIKKIRNQDTVDWDAAYPDHRALTAVSQAYISHFSPRIARQSASNISISPLSPDELIRFYQAYIVSKDTFTQYPVVRTISRKIQVPQISATFVALGGLVVVLNAVGLLYVIWFTWKHLDIVLYTPESKLDWAVQSISETPITSTATATATSPNPVTSPHKRFSVTASISSEKHLRMRKLNRVRAFFESARYGSHGEEQQSFLPQESIPLTQFASPLAGTSTNEHLRQGSVTSPNDNLVAPEPSFYNLSPYEAQFMGGGTTDTSYFPHQSGQNNPDYFVGTTDDVSSPPPSNSSSWNHRGYQRLGRPEA